MQASRPDASCTLFNSTLATSMAIPILRFFMRGLAWPLSITAYPGAAVDHRRRARRAGLELLRAAPRSPRRSRCGFHVAVEHHAIVLARGCERNLAFDHVALHNSASRSSGSPQPPPPVVTTRTIWPAKHRLAVDQAAEVARRALGVDR